MNEKPEPRDSKIRVFVVDDHPIVIRGLNLLINQEPDILVCGEADNGPAALQKIIELKPDVAIVDLSLKGSNGLELIKQLRQQSQKVKLLVFSMRAESIFAERALRAGANGYLTKEEGPEKAIEAIRTVMRGKRYLSRRIAEWLLENMAGTRTSGDSPIDSLSDRELEVLELLGQGLGSRDVAERIGVSIKTVESHRENIKSKLGLRSASELLAYAFNWLHGNESQQPPEIPDDVGL